MNLKEAKGIVSTIRNWQIKETEQKDYILMLLLILVIILSLLIIFSSVFIK